MKEITEGDHDVGIVGYERGDNRFYCADSDCEDAMESLWCIEHDLREWSL